VTQAETLMEGHGAEAVIADKAYGSDAVVAAAGRQGAVAVIPSKKNRKVPRDYDKHLYKERKKVEWFINLLKQYRRVATRYEKTGRNFLGFVYLASAMILMR
jgi:transposase